MDQPTPGTPTPSEQKPQTVFEPVDVIHPQPVTPLESKPRRRLLVRIIAAAIAILIVAAAVMGYIIFLQGKTAWGQAFQDDIWNELIDSAGSTAVDQSISVTYTDTGTFNFVPSKVAAALDGSPVSPEEAAEFDREYSFTLHNLAFNATFGGYINVTDPNKIKFDLHGENSFTNNSKTYSASFGAKLQEQEGYIKYNFNDELAASKYGEMVLTEQITQYRDMWLKLTDDTGINDLADAAKILALQTDPDDTTKQSPYKDILKRNRVFNIKSFKGVNFINGDPTLHYSFELDKTKLRNLILENARETFGTSYDSTMKEYVEQLTDSIVNKIEVETYDVWVGVKDQRIYKTVLVAKVLSITKTAGAIYDKIISGALEETVEPARSASRDAKRLADMRMMASALELYYNDNDGYPEVINGQPVDIAPTYVDVIPIPATPADGQCSEYDNAYWYKPIGTGKTVTNYKGQRVTIYPSYTYTFCFGAPTAGFAAGIHILTEQGFDSATVQPPSTTSNDIDKKMFDTVLNIVRELPFEAQLKVESSVKDFNQDKSIELPKDFKNINEVMEAMYGSYP